MATDVPRSRSELEASIEQARAEWGPRIERYNYLRERKARVEAELARLDASLAGCPGFELEWEYFQRLQLDGALPSLPRVRAPANTNHKNDGDEDLPEETEDHGRHESEFEIGSKG